MTDITSVRQNAQDVTAGEQLRGVSKVICWLDDDNYLVAGNDTGYTMEVNCPWASQAIVNAMLSRVRGYQYQPYSATAAAVDPAAELGDAVTVSGLYGGLYSRETEFGGAMRSDISAPLDMEVEHEYRYETSAERQFTRKFASVSSAITQTASQIAAEVTARTAANEQLLTRIEQNATEINAKVSSSGGSSSSFGWSLTSSGFTLLANGTTVMKCTQKNGLEVTGKISANSGNVGPWTIGSDAIRYGKGESGGLYFGTGGLYIGSKFVVSPSGVITASGAHLTGTLTVGGQTITAENLRAGAQSAVNNGSYWSGGSGWGYNFQNASIRNADGQPNFNAGDIRARNTLSGANVYAGNLFVGSTYVHLVTKTIAGVTINYVGY